MGYFFEVSRLSETLGKLGTRVLVGEKKLCQQQQQKFVHHRNVSYCTFKSTQFFQKIKIKIQIYFLLNKLPF